MRMTYTTHLDVSPPAVSSGLGEFQFFLFEAPVPSVGDLNKYQENTSDNSSSNHHKDAWVKVKHYFSERGRIYRKSSVL